MWNWKRYIGGGIALAVAVALASTVASTSVQADHRRSWSGMVMGGIIGGAIGSQFGKGGDRLAAIGAGALLGSLYGHHAAERHHRSWVHHRPVHRRHWQHGYRSHHRAWHAPRHRRHHGYHHRWKRAHTNTPVVVVPPTQVVVDPRPLAVDRALRSGVAADYIISGSESMAPRQYRRALTDCRVLEDGWKPVYACRNEGGGWSILR